MSDTATVTEAPPTTHLYDDVSVETLTERVNILSVLATTASALRAMHREVLYRRLGKGNKVTARHGEVPMGSASLSDPDALEAYVTDRDEFEKHCRVTYPEHIQDWFEIADQEKAEAVLREHAPHLLVPRHGVSAEAQEAALLAAVTVPVPGTSTKRKDSQLTVTPTKHTREAVKAILDSVPALHGLEVPTKKATAK